MRNTSIAQLDSVSVHENSTGHNLKAIAHGNVNHGVNSNPDNQDEGSTTSEEQAPERETYPKRQGLSWTSPEKIDGCINPKRHVDWVMMTYNGFSLEYLINLINSLCDQGRDRYVAYEVVMAEFGLDEMHADIVSKSLFGESFSNLVADIHGWISDYEPDEDDDWACSKRGMHDYLVCVVMENLAFVKMDEVNPNP